jgi:hypothetical protein
VPDPSDSPPSSLSARGGRVPTAVLAIVALVVVLGAFAVGRMHPFEPTLPPIGSSVVETRPSPNVILAIRDLARLETANYHIERVIELADQQSRLFGLLHAKDALMLVAVGDVVAGVDLTKIGDADITADWAKRSVHVKLPPPEVFSVTLDNARTHVVTRTTDTLANRREDLEGVARTNAEASMRTAAIDAGILDRARTSAQHAVTELLRALGFETVTVD